MTSIGRLPEKERRRARRRNHVARDLYKNKYHQRVVLSKKQKKKGNDYDRDYWENLEENYED